MYGGIVTSHFGAVHVACFGKFAEHVFCLGECIDRNFLLSMAVATDGVWVLL